MRFITLVVILFISLAACSHPTEEVKSSDNRPTIAVEGVSKTAELFIDGLSMGPASQYDGKTKSLRIVKGTHLVEVRDQGRTVLSEKTYLSGPSLTIFRP